MIHPTIQATMFCLVSVGHLLEWHGALTSMTIFHYKLLTRESMVSANE